MNLNDLPALLKMEGAYLAWFSQSIAAGEPPWSAHVLALERKKGTLRKGGFGYGRSPEEAILDALDDYKTQKYSTAAMARVKAKRPSFSLDIDLEDLEI